MAQPRSCEGTVMLARFDPHFREVVRCSAPAVEQLEGFWLCRECALTFRALLEAGPPWPWE